MKTTIIFLSLFIGFFVFTGNTFASAPTAIVPNGVAPVVGGRCLSFVWSGVEGTVSYKIEAFKPETEGIPSYEEIEGLAEPVLSKRVAADSLSWQPQFGDCLDEKGTYVWYVQAIDSDGNGSWSEGKRFALVEHTIQSPGLGGTEGTTNTFYGHQAGNSITTGTYNTFLGSSAGYSNTEGNLNSFIGASAGYSNTTGIQNTFLGYRAGYYNTTGYSNSFLGLTAGASNTTGYRNTFVGEDAGQNNTTGSENTFLGNGAGYDNTTGVYNTFIGQNAGYSNTTGYSNTFIGLNSGYGNTTGHNNTFIGFMAGSSNTDGAGNVFLGYNAGFNETGSNKLYIDNSDTSYPLIYGDFDENIVQIWGTAKIYSTLLTNGASAWGSAPFVMGQNTLNRGIVITDKAASNQKNIYFGWNVGATHEYAEIFALQEGVAYKNLILNPTAGYVGIGTTSPSYPLQMGSGAYVSSGGVWTNASSREYKKDIKELTKVEAMDAFTKLNPVKFSYKAGFEEKHVGFIAEDAPELVATKDRKGMSSMDVVAVLTKVVQEQQRTIAELSRRLSLVERRLE